MYRFERRAIVKTVGSLPQAMGWATELNGYLNSNYDVEVHFGVELFGAAAMTWYVDYDSLADLQAVNDKLIQDQGYWAMVQKSADFWVEGSLRDKVVHLMA